MRKTAINSNVSDTVSRLRALVLARPDGDFLGNEDSLERELEASKPTIRQAARVLEREGMLRVRRGNSGGYFGARPDAGFIEATVASYLEVLRARPEDLARVATALWVETVRRAAALPRERTAALLSRFRRAIGRLPPAAPYRDVQALDQKIRSAVFDLVDTPYVELIFDINANFARRLLSESPSSRDGDDAHREFVDGWRKAVILELEAIAAGDAEVSALAASRARQFFHRRIWPDDPI